MTPLDRELRAEPDRAAALEVKSYRLDAALVAQIRALAKRLKKSESAIVRAALRAGLGKR